MPENPQGEQTGFKMSLFRYLQYAYFLRFAILLWVVLPVLAYLDRQGVTTSLTRGIFALENTDQVIWAAFFVVTAGMVVLVTTRIVCTNGRSRFKLTPPRALVRLLGREKEDATQARKRDLTLLALVIAQVPGLATLGYVGKATVEEQGPGWIAFLGFVLIGIVSAALFWYIASLFYYWTYSDKTYDCATGVKRFSSEAMPLVFPAKWFGDLERSGAPWFAVHFGKLPWLTKLSYPGYAANETAPLWELHFFALVGLIWFALLYLALLPINAPVTLPWSQGLLFVSVVIPAFLLLLATVYEVRTCERSKCRWVPYVRGFFIFLTSAVIVLWVGCLAFHFIPRQPRAMPTLASVLVLSILLTWFLAGIAFFFDRLRVPVLTTALIIVFAPKLAFHTQAEEHYFSARESTAPSGVSAPFPAELLEKRKGSGPLVIVTATGGGIHAAGWTAEVMADLEATFAHDEALKAQQYTLHDHVLLVSGVSGGSVGLATYLREYTGKPGFENMADVRRRMTGAANCSSLSAVSWGLEYYDFANLLLSFLPPASGTHYKDGAPLGNDRSWALERAFDRNQLDEHCGTFAPQDQGLDTSGTLTLSSFITPAIEGKVPAFTLNTTAAETGDRFLLANYQVTNSKDPNNDVLPAESFLHAYGDPTGSANRVADRKFADLSLATASRLSATFPYVSSGSRIPLLFDSGYAFHFVDGGYFDNDGTSSVVEFVRDAFCPGVASEPNEKPKPCQKSDSGAAPAGKKGRIPILLIEIRDGWDLNPASNDDSYDRQVEKTKTDYSWKTTQQIAAPPKALWLAGHTSVTRRNRRELCLLEQAFADQISVHHLVFDFRSYQGEYQPLNWHLTENQQKRIACEGRKKRIQDRLTEATNWVKTVSLHPEQDMTRVCAVANPPEMRDRRGEEHECGEQPKQPN
jgi:hypothetical protein